MSDWRRSSASTCCGRSSSASLGFFLGAWIGREIAGSKDYLVGTDQNDVAVFMGFLFATIGWLAGLGFFNYPLCGSPAGPSATRSSRPRAPVATSV